MNNYENKYIKYKLKYIDLKNQFGGKPTRIQAHMIRIIERFDPDSARIYQERLSRVETEYVDKKEDVVYQLFKQIIHAFRENDEKIAILFKSYLDKGMNDLQIVKNLTERFETTLTPTQKEDSERFKRGDYESVSPEVLARSVEAMGKVFSKLDGQICAYCKQRKLRLPSCACKSVFYCSQEHQKADWPNHKENCMFFLKKQYNKELEKTNSTAPTTLIKIKTLFVNLFEKYSDQLTNEEYVTLLAILGKPLRLGSLASIPQKLKNIYDSTIERMKDPITKIIIIEEFHNSLIHRILTVQDLESTQTP